jgi:hypothetical protein
MAKYRIKTVYNGYYQIQRKAGFLLPWEDVEYSGWFGNYADAKRRLEQKIKDDKEWEIERKKRAKFKPKFYYPPLPDEEPK